MGVVVERVVVVSGGSGGDGGDGVDGVMAVVVAHRLLYWGITGRAPESRPGGAGGVSMYTSTDMHVHASVVLLICAMRGGRTVSQLGLPVTEPDNLGVYVHCVYVYACA